MTPGWRWERPDFDAELRHHLEESTELLVAQGWTEEEARREAERRFGDRRRVRRRLGRIHRHHRFRRAYYERLGADTEILGSVLRLERGPTTVVGVLRGGVKFPARGPPVDLWLPIRRDLTVQGRELRELRGFQSVWARLAPEVDFAQAQERADATAAALQSSRPREGGWEITLRPVGWSRTGQERPLGVLAATVVMLLAIAVANGVNLLLVRATGRSREFAVRIAMGGSRGELLRQLILEGVILGGLAAGMAVGLAWLSLETMQPLLPSGITWFSPHGCSGWSSATG